MQLVWRLCDWLRVVIYFLAMSWFLAVCVGVIVCVRVDGWLLRLLWLECSWDYVLHRKLWPDGDLVTAAMFCLGAMVD